MRKAFISVIILICLFSSLVVNGADYIDVIGKKEVIFEKTGEGSRNEINPDIRAYYARRKATRGAFYQFRNWLKSLDFEGQLLDELMNENQELRIKIEESLFKNYSIEEVKYPDGRVKIKFVRRWNGTELAQTLDKIYRKRSSQLNQVLTEEDKQVPEDNKNAKESTSNKTYQGYTGVIIDTRGYKIKPSMAPKIFDAEGKEVYGTMEADPDYVIEVGIVGYAYNLDEAKKNSRTGSNPIVVQATGRKGNAKDHAIISLEQAEFLRKMADNSNIFTKCRVMFVID